MALKISQKAKKTEKSIEKIPVSKRWVASAVVLLAANLLFFLTLWLLNKYDQVRLDQIIFQMKTSAAGANRSLLGSAFLRVGGFGIGAMLVEIFLQQLLSGKLHKLFAKSKTYLKYCVSSTAYFFERVFLPVALALLVAVSGFFVMKLNVVNSFAKRENS